MSGYVSIATSLISAIKAYTDSYRQVAANDDDERTYRNSSAIPSSPPPSFHSDFNSHRTSHDNHNRSEQEQNLNDAFDAPSDDESDDGDTQDRRRLITDTESTSPQIASTTAHIAARPDTSQRTLTQLPSFPIRPTSGSTRGNAPTNDGVFANLNAKPRVGDDLDEKPPTYEQAAADATPPYWETTVLSPYATTGNPDDVFVDGLLVGSLFSFVWNGLISVAIQPLIGFLLTYLLHTTHAAKHGSRAGLGITMVQYGFQLRYAASNSATEPGSPTGPVDGVPEDPNSHNFDPDAVTGGNTTGMAMNDWLSYASMIVGWFILIRAASDYMRARRQEALVRSSPERGLNVAVVAEGEHPESTV